MLVLPGFPVVSGSEFPDVEFVSGGGADANTVSIPSHQAGDMILIVAGMFGSGSTIPAAGAGFSTIVSELAAGRIGYRVGYKIAVSSSETSGTWTSAERMAVAVYRNALSVGNVSSLSYGGGSSASTPAWPALNPDSPPAYIARCLAFGIVRQVAATPAGYEARAISPTGAVPRVRVIDTGGAVSSVPQTNHPTSDTTQWLSMSVELKNTP